MLNYTIWSPLPDGFTNTCIPISGDECERTRGWITAGASLISGAAIDTDIVLILSKSVEINDFAEAYV
jgi:hypothetical protein